MEIFQISEIEHQSTERLNAAIGERLASTDWDASMAARLQDAIHSRKDSHRMSKPRRGALVAAALMLLAIGLFAFQSNSDTGDDTQLAQAYDEMLQAPTYAENLNRTPDDEEIFGSEGVRMMPVSFTD